MKIKDAIRGTVRVLSHSKITKGIISPQEILFHFENSHDVKVEKMVDKYYKDWGFQKDFWFSHDDYLDYTSVDFVKAIIPIMFIHSDVFDQRISHPSYIREKLLRYLARPIKWKDKIDELTGFNINDYVGSSGLHPMLYDVCREYHIKCWKPFEKEMKLKYIEEL